MRKLGFHDKWIRLVMSCVSSVTYAVRVNGVPYGHISPTRGLRQGDPLSPYLFLIVAEGLSALLHKAVQEKKLRGVAASTKGPRISHLFFDDDSLIFGRATTMECNEIQRILQVYKTHYTLFENKNILVNNSLVCLHKFLMVVCLFLNIYAQFHFSFF